MGVVAAQPVQHRWGGYGNAGGSGGNGGRKRDPIDLGWMNWLIDAVVAAQKLLSLD